MKKRLNYQLVISIILLFVIMLFPSCTKTVIRTWDEIPVDKRLLGTWQSDKERTVRWLRKNRKFSEERINRIVDKLKLGTLIVEINEDISYGIYEGKITEENNNIVAIATDTVAVVNLDPLTCEPVLRIITIEDENSYSIYIDNFDFREYFKRIE